MLKPNSLSTSLSTPHHEEVSHKQRYLSSQTAGVGGGEGGGRGGGGG